MAKKTPPPEKGKERALTEQQKLFVEYLCADPTHNRTEAAKLAGYSEKTASQLGYQLVQIPSVRIAIDARLKDIHARVGLKAEKVLAYLHDSAFVDPIVYENVRSLTDLKALTPEQRRAVVGYSYTQSGEFVLELAIEKSRELLGKHFKLFTDKVEFTDKTGLASKLAAARRRREAKK